MSLWQNRYWGWPLQCDIIICDFFIALFIQNAWHTMNLILQLLATGPSTHCSKKSLGKPEEHRIATPGIICRIRPWRNVAHLWITTFLREKALASHLSFLFTIRMPCPALTWQPPLGYSVMVGDAGAVFIAIIYHPVAFFIIFSQL